MLLPYDRRQDLYFKSVVSSMALKLETKLLIDGKTVVQWSGFVVETPQLFDGNQDDRRTLFGAKVFQTKTDKRARTYAIRKTYKQSILIHYWSSITLEPMLRGVVDNEVARTVFDAQNADPRTKFAQ
jgi:hypothetical protein